MASAMELTEQEKAEAPRSACLVTSAFLLTFPEDEFVWRAHLANLERARAAQAGRS